MASSKKTNKTSHVMNLLTNGAAPEAGGSPEAPASGAPLSPDNSTQEKKGDIQSHTVTPKKVTVVDEGSRNDRLSQEILTKLSEELDEEASGAASSSPVDGDMDAQAPADGTGADGATAEDPAPADQPAEDPSIPEEENGSEIDTSGSLSQPAATDPSQEEVSDAVSESADTPSEPSAAASGAPQPNPSTAHHAIIPKSQIGSNLLNDQYSFVNIMEQLILRQDINSYLEQYNVCKCPRCMADVCALALSGMPPKYVVTSKDSISPLLSYYESRNKILMLTELIKACNKVRENPRHEKQ